MNLTDNEPRATVIVRIPESLKRALDECADKANKTRNAAVIEILTAFLTDKKKGQ